MTSTSTRTRVGEHLGSRPAPLLLCAATFAAYVGVAIIQPGLPMKTAFVDPILFCLCVYALVTMVYQGSPATSGAARLLPWCWLILLGSFLGLAGVGIPEWAISNLGRTVFALLTFVCMWHLVGTARVARFAIYGTAAGLAITCGSLLVQAARYRDSAFFQHPNYAGHYCVMASMVLFAVTKRWYWKVAAALGLLIAIQQTSSFGAIAMFIAMMCVYAVRALTRNTAILATGLAILAIGGLFLATPQAADLLPDDTSGNGWAISETISETRFEKSQDSRLALWSQAIDAYSKEPLGLGPDGVRQRDVAQYRGVNLEIHSDALGYLVERGVLGLIGFVGLWATLILIAKKGGLARVLIAGMLVQGLFRETMHYRHMWLLLALAFVIDYAKDDPPPDDDREPLEVEEVSSARTGGTDYFPGVAPWPNVP